MGSPFFDCLHFQYGTNANWMGSPYHSLTVHGESMLIFKLVTLIVALAPIGLVAFYINSMLQQVEYIEELKVLGSYLIGSAAIIFWSFFFVFWSKTKSSGKFKLYYAILFFLGSFLSPIFCWYKLIFKSKN